MLSPYGAQIPANTTADRLGNVCSISLTSRVLPDPASPVTATTALRPFATIDITDDEQLTLVGATDERDVGAHADRRQTPVAVR